MINIYSFGIYKYAIIVLMLGSLVSSLRSVIRDSSRNLKPCLKPCLANKQPEFFPKKKVVIIGGGFGGLYTALRLEELAGGHADITMIDKKEKFVFLPLLYDLTIRSATVSEVAPMYGDLLVSSKIVFQRGTVTDVDFSNNTVKMTSYNNELRDLSYDYLVLAPGSQPRIQGIPGAKEHAIAYHQVEDAYNLRLKLEQLINSNKKDIRVVIVGGGYSGVELATNVAEYIGKDRGSVTIINKQPKILPTASDHNRKIAERCLEAVGVAVLSDKTVESIQSNSITVSELKEDQKIFQFDIPADIILLTAGTEPNNLISSFNLSKSKYGKVNVDRTLKVLDTPNVYSLGDCCQVDDLLIAPTAQCAIQQSQTVANNIAVELKGESPMKIQEFSYTPLGEMLTLGFKEGAVTGIGGLVKLDGPTAAIARRLTYAVRMPTSGQTINALIYAGLSTASKILSSISSRA